MAEAFCSDLPQPLSIALVINAATTALLVNPAPHTKLIENPCMKGKREKTASTQVLKDYIGRPRCH
jgi:hypothetical protein